MCNPASIRKTPEAIDFRESFGNNHLSVGVHTCPFALQNTAVKSTKHPHLFRAAEKISRMPNAKICSAV